MEENKNEIIANMTTGRGMLAPEAMQSKDQHNPYSGVKSNDIPPDKHAVKQQGRKA